VGGVVPVKVLHGEGIMTEAVCVKSQTQSIKGQLDSEGEVFYLMAASRPDLQFPFETRRAEQNVLPPSPTSASRKIVSLERNVNCGT
jgi:hypothetical protein